MDISYGEQARQPVTLIALPSASAHIDLFASELMLFFTDNSANEKHGKALQKSFVNAAWGLSDSPPHILVSKFFDQLGRV